MGQDEAIPEVRWDIQRKGRAWSPEEWNLRRELTPNKNELSRGRLYYSDEALLNMLALLLENIGADRAVRLGDPRVWRAAIAALGDETG